MCPETMTPEFAARELLYSLHIDSVPTPVEEICTRLEIKILRFQNASFNNSLHLSCVFLYLPVPSKPLFYWHFGLFLFLLCYWVIPNILTVLGNVLGIRKNSESQTIGQKVRVARNAFFHN